MPLKQRWRSLATRASTNKKNVIHTIAMIGAQRPYVSISSGIVATLGVVATNRTEALTRAFELLQLSTHQSRADPGPSIMVGQEMFSDRLVF